MICIVMEYQQWNEISSTENVHQFDEYTQHFQYKKPVTYYIKELK